MSLLPVLALVLLQLGLAESKAFGAGSSNPMQSSFHDENLIDWQSIFAGKRAAYPLMKRNFGDHPVGSLDRGNMMDWASMFSKRNFGGNSGSFGNDDGGQFVNWVDNFAPRGGRVRRATHDADEDSQQAEKRFGGGDEQEGFGNGGGYFSRQPMQFTDWRDTFARAYRSWDSNAMPAFGEHSSGMVNWKDYFKRAAEKASNKHEEAVEEKKDTN